jgi:hypothetical protein
MLYHTLTFLADELNTHLIGKRTASENIPDKLVIPANISKFNHSKRNEHNNILLSLVNITEDPNLKNTYQKLPAGSKPQSYNNQLTVYNLQVIFSACLIDYELSLKYISYIIGFFKEKSVFASQNGPGLFVQHQNLNLQEVNFIWTIMGGNHHPFICYQIRTYSSPDTYSPEISSIIQTVKNI